MSTTIITRASKGGRLSFTDMDNNLLNLQATADAAAVQTVVDSELALKANTADLSDVATTGSYNDLLDKPTLFTGSYTDLTDKPAFATVSTSGSYTDLTDKPTLFSGSYVDLTNKPSLFSGDYADLTGKPTLFSGVYADLTDKPALFSGSYTDLTNKPTIPTIPTLVSAFTNDADYSTNTEVNTKIDAALNDLIDSAPGTLNTLGQIAAALTESGSAVDSLTTAIAGKVSLTGTYADPTWITSLAYSKLTGAPVLATVATSGSYNDLTDKPTAFSGAYADLTGKPSLFSGAYADLTGKPTLATVATSGSYNDLSDKPTAFSGAYADLTGVPSLSSVAISGSYTDLLNKPSLATVATTGSYNSLSNRPTIPTTVTINGTSITLGSSGTITASTSKLLTIGSGLKSTSSTFNGSAANTIELDTSVQTINIISYNPNFTEINASASPNINVIGGDGLSGTYTIYLPPIYNLTYNRTFKIHINTSINNNLTIAIRIGTNLVGEYASGSRAVITLTALDTSSYSTSLSNWAITQSMPSLTGTGTQLVTDSRPTINNLYTTTINGTGAVKLYSPDTDIESPSSLTIGNLRTGGTVNIYTNSNSEIGYSKTINIGTNDTVANAQTTVNIATSSTGRSGMQVNIGTTTNSTINLRGTVNASITGNAATVTNGVYTNGSYSNPSWITSLAWSKITGAPTSSSSFSGSYNDLTDKPTIPSLTGYATESYVTTAIDDLIGGAPGTLDTLKEIADQLSSDESAVSALTTTVAGKVSLSGSYSDPSWITSLAYSKLTGTPTLATVATSGDYADLINKPTIPSLTGYATESYVTTAIDNLIGGAPGTLDTLKEIADQLTSDESAVTALTTTVAGKVSLSGSYDDPTWLNSLAYSKLTGTPTIPTKTSDLTNDAGFITGVTNISGNAGTVTNGVYTTDTGTVTDTMLAGNIANSKLTNSSVTINGTAVALGDSATITAKPPAATIVTVSTNGSYNISAYETILSGTTTGVSIVLPDTDTCYIGQTFIVRSKNASYTTTTYAYGGVSTSGLNITAAGALEFVVLSKRNGAADSGSNWTVNTVGASTVTGTGAMVLQTNANISGPTLSGTSVVASNGAMQFNTGSVITNSSQTFQSYVTNSNPVQNFTTTPSAISGTGVWTMSSSGVNTPVIGQAVTISGTNTGTAVISGYTSGNTYYIIGTPSTTSITLAATRNSASNGFAVTTAGTIAGLTFSFAPTVSLPVGTAGSIYYLTGSITSNFDLVIPYNQQGSGQATSATLIISQGTTPYMINNLYMATPGSGSGNAQPISWQGGNVPLGNANKRDVITLSWLPAGTVWINLLTLGQMTTYG